MTSEQEITMTFLSSVTFHIGTDGQLQVKDTTMQVIGIQTTNPMPEQTQEDLAKSPKHYPPGLFPRYPIG